MKPDTRKGGDLRPANPGATPPPDDLSNLLASIEAEEQALALRKAKAESALWDDVIAKVKPLVQVLTARGYDAPKIAKAVGLQSRLVPASDGARKGTGPTSNAGWFQLFRSRAIQVYVKTHPELAASLKAQKIRPSQQAAHIPAEDLKRIEFASQSKADAKCPPVSAA